MSAKKPWSESDLRTVEKLEELRRVAYALSEELNVLMLKIHAKYQLPEAQQPHNKAQD